MTNLEDELRSSLSQRADAVPSTVSDQLSRGNYHPRPGHRGLASAAAAAALAVGVGALYLSAGSHPGTVHAPFHPAASGQTINLAGFVFTLPAGSRASDVPCASTPPPTPGAPETVDQAGGVFTPMNGGCLQGRLGGPTAPADAQPVAIGTYHGFIVSDQPDDSITLYVDISTTHTFVLTSTGTGLSEQQLIGIAADGLPPCSPELENAPNCN